MTLLLINRSNSYIVYLLFVSRTSIFWKGNRQEQEEDTANLISDQLLNSSNQLLLTFSKYE